MKALAQNTLIQNRYLVVHLIGKGGMGEVYLAVDQRLGSAVALKRTFFAGDETLGGAFEREARTLARMRHPVLPKVSDHFTEGEEQYLVMEHIAGDDLAKRLEAAQKPFPVSWVMFWADQLLDALSYLHSHEPPIIHRDIKPQNLKLTDENHIILLDFGLSKTSTGQTYLNSNTGGSTGSVVGYTPHYAPMEQIRGIGTNPRSDLYSLSATLYQLLTNVVPADALSRADAMLNGSADPIEPPHLLNPEVPTAVSLVILKGLEVSQERRFGNARDMQKAMRRAFSQMQEAMAAQTVAFNINDVLPAEARPPAAPVMAEPELMPEPVNEVVPTPEVEPEPEPESIGAAGFEHDRAVDLDATLAFAPPETFDHPIKHSEIQTELYQPSTESNGTPDPNSGPILPIPEPPAAVPSHAEQNSFVTVAAGASSPFAEFQAPREEEAPPPPVRTKPKSSGKALAVIGGLAAILVLGLGAAGAGWYYYSNFYAVEKPAEATPSPAPSLVESTPMPSPSQEAVVVDTAPTPDSGSNTASDLGDTTSQTPVRNDIESTPARSNTAGPRPAPSRPITSVPKATPKPKTNPGRTDIQQ